jgi:uncharacterized protein YciI
VFVIALHYIKPLSEVDRFVAEHIAFLDRHYASGHFLVSGRKEPRTGGVIIAQVGSRAEIERIVAQDPFQREGIAQYEITEFLPSKCAPPLVALL